MYSLQAAREPLPESHLTQRLFGQILGASSDSRGTSPDRGPTGARAMRVGFERAGASLNGRPGPTNSDARVAHGPCVARMTCVNVSERGERVARLDSPLTQRDDGGGEWSHIANPG